MRRSFVLAVLTLFFANALRAQEAIHLASLRGRVTDPSNAAISGAGVLAKQTDTNSVSSAVADQEGRFRFPYLRPGSYEIAVRASGFGDFVRQIVLSTGSEIALDIQLGVASVETRLSVTDESEIVESARTQIAGTVAPVEIDNLPVNGRSFLDVALLIPGVSPTNTASNQLFAETSAVPGQGLSVNSQRNFSNNFIVDGLSANDDAAGLSGIFYGYDAVSEFQVVTSGGQAEFGRALGGYMNVVTKSGTNTFHGSLYGYLRNQRFNAANPLAQLVLPMTHAQYGASVGGPIVRDRTFYFGNFEQRNLNQSGLITIDEANVTAINARLAALGYQGPSIFRGIYPNPVHSLNALGKIDHQFTSGDRLTLRYNLYDVNSRNSRGAGGLNAASASANLDNTDHTFAVGNVATLSPRLVNETRGQFTRSDLKAPPSDLVGPAVSIAGVASFGRLSSSPTGRLNKLYEVIDNISYQTGAHAIRFGATFLHNDDTIEFPRSVRGSYAFSSLANFLNGVYNNSGFTQTFNNATVRQTNPNAGFYGQDEWQVASRLTLNFGIRYDLQFLKTIQTDTNNWSPRMGFAWTPLASHTLAVRGGYGLFYDRMPLRALANALLSAGNTTDAARLSQISISLSPTQAGAPVFPNTLASLTLPPGVLFNFTTLDKNMKTAYSEQANLEIERQVGKDKSLSIGYQYLRGAHLIMSVNRNVPTCVAVGTNNGCRPDSNYANNSQYSPQADSNYHGMHVSFVQRPSKRGHYRISYTYSKAFDNVGEFFFSSPIDNFNVWRDYGRSDDDQRHRLTVDGAIVSHGFTLSGMIQAYSSLPFNVIAGATTIQGTTARPTINGEFIGRNSGKGFAFFNMNARLARAFQLKETARLEATAEAFNSTNHVNGVALNGTFGTGTYPSNPLPTFRQITAVAEPRTLQFGLRVLF